jgi:hypothetical protein
MDINRKSAIIFRTLALISFIQALLSIAFDVHTPVGVPYGS